MLLVLSDSRVAEVVELVDAQASGACEGFPRGGSSPPFGIFLPALSLISAYSKFDFFPAPEFSILSGAADFQAGSAGCSQILSVTL